MPTVGGGGGCLSLLECCPETDVEQGGRYFFRLL